MKIVKSDENITSDYTVPPRNPLSVKNGLKVKEWRRYTILTLIKRKLEWRYFYRTKSMSKQRILPGTKEVTSSKQKGQLMKMV